MVFEKIEEVSEEKLEKIKNLSAFSLPINPSERGFTPEQIKKRFYEPIVGQALSVLTELARVIVGINRSLDVLNSLLEGERVGGDDGGAALEDLIILSERGKTLKEYAERIETELTRISNGYYEVTGAIDQANEHLASAQKASEDAQGYAEDAQNCANGAQEAKKSAAASAKEASEAYNGFVNTKIETQEVPYGERPSVTKNTVAGTTTIIFSLPTGAPFRLAKIFSSVNEMNRGWGADGVKVGEFVMVSSEDVEDPDNATLYCKGESGYEFIVDFSGAVGIQGPKGIPGKTPVRGEDYFTEEDVSYFEQHLEETVNSRLGELEGALDGILALQESLIGGVIG